MVGCKDCRVLKDLPRRVLFRAWHISQIDIYLEGESLLLTWGHAGKLWGHLAKNQQK